MSLITTKGRCSPACVHTEEQGLISEATSHTFIAARADVLETQTQGHLKQVAAINRQINLCMYYGPAGCQPVHTLSAQAAILNAKAELK